MSNLTPRGTIKGFIRSGGGGGGSVNYIENLKILVGEDVSGSATLTSGWETIEGGYKYTYSSGNAGNPLTISTTAELDSVYLLEFTTNYTSGEFVTVAIGNAYPTLVYKSLNNLAIPLKAIGNNNLIFTPVNNASFEITNIKLRKIQEEGTPVILDYATIFTDNHKTNYGYWNTLLGRQCANNAVGTSRTVAIGGYTLQNLEGGHRNIAIGTFAMNSAIGAERNVSIGADNMMDVNYPQDNISLGFSAMHHGNTMKHNIAIGSGAMGNVGNRDVTGNVAIGKDAGYAAYGPTNICIGYQAGNSITSGASNVVIGSLANSSTNQNQNVCIGASAEAQTGTSRSIAIGYNAKTTKSYQMMLGSSAITEVVMCGNKKIIFNNDGTVTWETLT